MASNIPHIFVVEDDDINRAIIVEYVDDMRDEYIVETAVDGEDAWDLLQKNPHGFDVILLDRMMPKMDGMALLSKIKSHPILRILPVIFQSAMAAKSDIAEGLRAGAHYYLTKPFDIDVLQSVIRTAVRDRMEYRRMTAELTSQFSTMSCLTNAEFKFKTVQEGKNLAILLANTCDNKEKAVTGLTELLVNAVEHGNLAITYAEKSELTSQGNLLAEINRRLLLDEYKNRAVKIEINRLPTQVEFTITDEGKGFDWEPYLEMSPNRASDNHGRGIAMAGLVSFDKLEYIGNGNKVKAFINIK